MPHTCALAHDTQSEQQRIRRSLMEAYLRARSRLTHDTQSANRIIRLHQTQTLSPLSGACVCTLPLAVPLIYVCYLPHPPPWPPLGLSRSETPNKSCATCIAVSRMIYEPWSRVGSSFSFRISLCVQFQDETFTFAWHQIQIEGRVHATSTGETPQ